jgi:phosphate/sulfate permease
MVFWQSDAACVRFLMTFRIMPRWYKLLDLSIILSPILTTFIAYTSVRDGILGYFWVVLAGLYWLIYSMYALAFARGYSARRKGIAPSLPGKEPNLSQQRGFLIVLIVIIVVFGAAFTGLYISYPRPLKGHDWSPELVLPILFFQQVSAFARNRFWNVVLE